MRPSRKMVQLLRILAFLSVFFVSVRVADSQDPLCLNNGNYTANEAFDWKLDNLLGSIATMNSSEFNDDGLFNASEPLSGISDIVQVLGYCRGDETSDACRSCLIDAADQVRQMCPLQKQAVLFEDKCTLKYANGSMYGVVSEAPFLRQSSGNATDWGVFETVLKQLLDELGSRAASGGLRKYAQDSRPVDLYTLYAAVMCSPDLSNQQCSDCLVSVTEKLKPGYEAGNVKAPSCQVRYDISRFFDPIATPSPPPLAVSVIPETRNKISSKVWVAVGVSTASAVLIGVAIFLWVKRKRNSTQSLRNEAADEVIFETLQYSLDIIKDATDNFSEANKLGQGGFGSVFRGKFPNGQEIAVKQLSKNSRQGPLEFKNEVALLGRLQHKNLVRLLGFCLESDERLLVYEFLPNSSLDQFIFDPLKRRGLHWVIRHKIITGIARGLLYLHEESGHRIVHRDLKASNILLDREMNPKLSDFGMARLFKIDQTQADTSRIVGTHGYMAPEYLMHGHFSAKSDVFSFGVLVLEIVSGRRNLDFIVGEEPEVLISRVWRNWCEGKISSIIDPLVETGYSLDIKRCIHIGLACVQEDVALRPTMASIIPMLNSNSTSLPVPIQPAFSMASQILPELGNTSETSRRSNTENTTGSSSTNEHSTTNPNPL